MQARFEPPSILQVEITSHCNLKCRMCPLTTRDTASSLVPGHMSPMTWRKVLAAARDVGYVMLSGFGEPFTNPQFLSLLQDLEEGSIYTSMSTNGVALTPRAAKILSSLPHLYHINVSIDSPDPLIYAETRGGELERALQGLRSLMTAIDNPQRVTVSSVLMMRNLPSLVDMPARLAEMGVRKYILQGVVNLNSDGLGQHLCDVDDAEAYVAGIRAACSESGVELVFTMPDQLQNDLRALPVTRSRSGTAGSPPEKSRQCGIPWELAFIDRDGLIYPCCYASAMRGQSLGNLNEQSLADIWEGSAYRKFRQGLLDGNLSSCCQDCNAAAVGEHPLRRYAAELDLKASSLGGRGEVRLVVKNRGVCTWDQETRLRIGTAAPRDSASRLYHPARIAPHRVTSFRESSVAPGESATFVFPIQPPTLAVPETFRLLVEDISWLPATTFRVPHYSARARVVSAVRQSVKALYRRGRALSVRQALRRTQ